MVPVRKNASISQVRGLTLSQGTTLAFSMGICWMIWRLVTDIIPYFFLFFRARALVFFFKYGKELNLIENLHQREYQRFSSANTVKYA